MDLSVIEKHLRPSYYKKQTNKLNRYVGLAPQAYLAFLGHIDVIDILIK
jgi:hypothetical protein